MLTTPRAAESEPWMQSWVMVLNRSSEEEHGCRAIAMQCVAHTQHRSHLYRSAVQGVSGSMVMIVTNNIHRPVNMAWS